MSLKENDTFYEHQHENKKEKALKKAFKGDKSGGLIGRLKHTMRDKTDHYAEFKKQHKMK